MLDYEELEELIETITSMITVANRSGELEQLLKGWNLDHLILGSSVYATEKSGKIVVIGESEVKENVLRGLVKKYGINVNRFEFCLDYGAAKKYPYKKLRYNTNYRLVIFGPVPHSSSGKNDSTSVIAEMKNNEGYPRVEVLSSNREVKITKSNFKKLLEQLIDENYI